MKIGFPPLINYNEEAKSRNTCDLFEMWVSNDVQISNKNKVLPGCAIEIKGEQKRWRDMKQSRVEVEYFNYMFDRKLNERTGTSGLFCRNSKYLIKLLSNDIQQRLNKVFNWIECVIRFYSIYRRVCFVHMLKWKWNPNAIAYWLHFQRSNFKMLPNEFIKMECSIVWNRDSNSFVDYWL